MTSLRCEYRFTLRFGHSEHNWLVIGARGGLQLRISEHPSGHYAGLEIHHRTPPAWAKEDAPSHDRCWVLDCACWHDGTSIYAEDKFLPIWKAAPHAHADMFVHLVGEYHRVFKLEAAPCDTRMMELKK
jgi:hypothetical protein